MKRTSFPVAVIIGFIVFPGLASCFIFLGPTRCCNFDPSENKLTLSCQGQKMHHVEVSYADPKTYRAEGTLLDTSLDYVETLSIARPPDSIIKTKLVVINVWYDKYVIWDYWLEVKPEDWKTGKIAYGRYSYR